jgi:uroporphyrinogen-III decarboxylase
MSKETMTSNERIAAAINLEKPDRVPVVPLLPPEPIAGLAGLTQGQVATDCSLTVSGFFQIFEEYGGWDAAYGGPITPEQLQVLSIYPMKVRIPGKDTDENDIFQLLEEEVMTPEDYDKIIEMGYETFYNEEYLKRICNLTPEEIADSSEALMTAGFNYIERLQEIDINILFVVQNSHPFFTLSLMRSLVPFTKDLYYDAEPVKKALRIMTDELIAKELPNAKGAKDFGIYHWLFVEERASCYHYPPKIFEEFWWPYTKEIVDAFWSEGIVTFFHLDTCWDKNLEYFKELPKGSAVVGLDSTTDIFLAKEILGGHLCLYGDLSATMLARGKKEDVEGYCKKLIDEVGKDGGFILGSGCAVPPDCDPENFRAMLETTKNYEFSK